MREFFRQLSEVFSSEQVNPLLSWRRVNPGVRLESVVAIAQLDAHNRREITGLVSAQSAAMFQSLRLQENLPVCFTKPGESV